MRPNGRTIMVKPQIINIINFIRGVEPRDLHLNLLEPVKKQIKLLKKFQLPATFLVQYDALLQKEYTNLLKCELDEKYEIGGWLEIVQPLVEKAGLKWRGRENFSWDWHANVGCIIGYVPKEREKLVDVFMNDFKQIFGKYPKSVGAWLIDAHTLAYLADKYAIVASCNCKDQVGTDGYTLWGGYYNQAYYPSCKNVFSPAQSLRNQIPVPVFRMLGSDPIYQYDAGLIDRKGLIPSKSQPVITLEPVYTGDGGGGVPKWVRWYFKENFGGMCLSFGYAQVGQENSFGWKAMAIGFRDQVKLIAKNTAEGKLRVETLRDSGRWFKTKYKMTPASAVAALTDWRKTGHKSIWYYNRFYRVNFFWNGEKLYIRDLYRFDEQYPERYLTTACAEKNFIYDNLPVMDGYRWSEGIRAGIYFAEILPNNIMIPVKGGNLTVEEASDDELKMMWQLKKGGGFKIHCRGKFIIINYINVNKNFDWGMQMCWNKKKAIININDKLISYKHNQYQYAIYATTGSFSKTNKEGGIFFCPSKNKMVLKLR